MQEVYEKVFNIACEELPHKHFIFNNQEGVLYRGFKISKKNGKFYWQDIRNSNSYEPVDPRITKHILLKGFIDTLKQVTIHNDEDKMCKVNRKVFDINRRINYWTAENTNNRKAFKRQEAGLLLNQKLTQQQIENRIITLHKKYCHKKNFYFKKRRVLKQKLEQQKAEYAFYLSRIKLYKI